LSISAIAAHAHTGRWGLKVRANMRLSLTRKGALQS
jgi:hypothetical protein